METRSALLNAFRRKICPCGAQADTTTRTGRMCKPCAARQPQVCDFCSQPEIKVWYPCRSFVDAVIVRNGGEHIEQLRSEAEWGACQTCREIIEREDYDALAVRSRDLLAQEIELTPAEHERMLESIKMTHGNFRRLRYGVARPVVMA